jgi:hypothetical protein
MIVAVEFRPVSSYAPAPGPYRASPWLHTAVQPLDSSPVVPRARKSRGLTSPRSRRTAFGHGAPFRAVWQMRLLPRKQLRLGGGGV